MPWRLGHWWERFYSSFLLNPKQHLRKRVKYVLFWHPNLDRSEFGIGFAGEFLIAFEDWKFSPNPVSEAQHIGFILSFISSSFFVFSPNVVSFRIGLGLWNSNSNRIRLLDSKSLDSDWGIRLGSDWDRKPCQKFPQSFTRKLSV